ncbi:RNA 2',3'-cyclic phosphodiesterase [Aliiruegeria haliotis]|uniref:RNA 2',3'-cyclic phosphodiesterase n=1 Tax=Aliiruegeria haliotis TaxID=1280846 RepID=UPI001304E685|nr:RNA 2',3'-cyclic phosphodiesterase [Aliiruegeria haliotis]
MAIRPTEDALDRLQALQREIPAARLPPRENLHLTLSFLDDLDDALLAALHERLEAIRQPAFDVTFRGVDLFPGKAPKILYAAIRPDPALLALHGAVRRAAETVGIGLKRERYRPHVTLGRFNRPPGGLDADRLGAFLAVNAMLGGGFAVSGFSLFRSELGGGPARHTELACYPLGSVSEV